MSFRMRNKGYQLDIHHNEKRYRTQILGDKHDAAMADAFAKKELKLGTPWNEIQNKINVSRHDTSIGAIYSKVKASYTDRHGQQTCFNVVQQVGPNMKISDVDEERIDLLIEKWRSAGNSNGTCNRKLAALSKLFTYAMKRKLLKSKPQIEWLKEGAGKTRYMKPEEELLFCNLLKSGGHDDLADMIVVACDTGLRKSELKRIDLKSDLNDNRLTCQATKNDTIRTITLTKRSLAILKRRDNRSFINMSDELMRSAWNYGKIKAGLEYDKEFTFHCTRHTCASRLVQSGIPILVVQQWLGHKTIKMTLRYSHLAPRNFEEAKNVLEEIVVTKAVTV